VSGGVIAVLPGKLGIGVFSPKLDERGNSVRGIAVCRDLSRDLSLHLIAPGSRLAPPIRSSYRVGEIGSKRVRHGDELAKLLEGSDRTAVFELQGELNFMSLEAVSRAVTKRDPCPELVLLDLRRVNRIDRSGAEFSSALASFLDQRGGKLVFSCADLLEPIIPPAMAFPDLDAALEWCEEELLFRIRGDSEPRAIPLELHELLQGLSPRELGRLSSHLEAVNAKAGALIVRAGEPAAQIFLVISGSLSVLLRAENQPDLRLSTLTAGMTFGEIAYIERSVRSADVRADSDVECLTLSFASLDSLTDTDPRMHGKLLRNLMRVVVSRLRSSNAEVAELTR
jgi:glutaminase